MTKKVAIVPAGGGDVREVTVEPGTTAKDIIKEAELEGFLLAKPGSDEFLAESEVVYPLVVDGDKLVASTPAIVGSPGGPTALSVIGALVNKIERATGIRMGNDRSSNLINISELSNRLKRQIQKVHKVIRVKPDNRPYWVQRRWKKDGNVYTGFYRTKYGSWEGRIKQFGPSGFAFMIIKPPQELLCGPHSLCFQEAGEDRYKIHFKFKPTDISSGILSVEKTIGGSFKCYPKT